MSSSAALECSLAFGLNELFDLGLDTWDLIRASQMAEHHFVGIKCGIMDQFASMLGKPNSVMLLDCRTLEYAYVPLDLGDYQLLLLNTQVSHELASSDFNLRRSSCEEGLAFFQKQHSGVTSLRDVDGALFEKYKQNLPVPIANRVRHVLTENDRVLQATDALAKQDFKRLGELMYASHESLQHDYEVSCPELDFLVDLSRQNPAVLGSRMMGGGFGGCTLNLIHSTAVERFISESAEAYSRRFGIQLVAYPVQIGSGASECEV
jgi:galactokinase